MARGTVRKARGSAAAGGRSGSGGRGRSGSGGWQGSPVVTVVVSAIVWALVAVPSVWAVFRLTGTEDGYPAFALLAYTPWAALGALVPLGVALLARRRTAAMVASFALIGLVAVVVPRVIPGGGPDPAPTGPRLRVVSLNLQFGLADTRQIMGVVKANRADVLSLQEAPPAALRRLERAGLRDRLPYRVADDDNGSESGAAALYARFPLHRLPEREVTAEFRMPYARMDVPGAPPVEIMSVHPTPPMTEAGVAALQRSLARMPSANEAATSGGEVESGSGERGAERGVVRVLAGDFNSTLDNAALRQVIDRGYVDAGSERGAGLAWTWPMEGRSLPGVTIDHILADARVQVEDYGVGRVTGTDHAPVYARLRLPAG